MPVQLTLADLYNLAGPKPKARAANSQIIALKRRKNQKRFAYVVRSSEDYSDPDGHLVSFMYPNLIPFTQLKYYLTLTPTNRRALVHCTCPAWQYWGSAYLSTRESYALVSDEDRAANERDPEEENYICKHVCCVYQNLKKKSFPQLLTDFTVTAADQSKPYTAFVRPILAAYLDQRGTTASVVDAVNELTEANYEAVLTQHGALVDPPPDWYADGED